MRHLIKSYYSKPGEKIKITWMRLFAHESDRSQKLLLETEKIRLSGLANRMIQFCRFRQQSGAPSALDE
jgi:hypothetical protein